MVINRLVAVVEDDDAVRRSIARLLRSADMSTQEYASAEEFFASEAWLDCGCILLDLRMPGASGLRVQDELRARGCEISVVFLTGHGDVTSSVRAMKSGAVDFLQKPVEEAPLIAAVESALLRTEDSCAVSRRVETARVCYRRLTPRERDVFAEIVSGKSNREAGAVLGIAEQTVKIHRGRVMEKMLAGSLADLVRIAAILGLEPPDHPSGTPDGPVPPGAHAAGS